MLFIGPTKCKNRSIIHESVLVRSKIGSCLVLMGLEVVLDGFMDELMGLMDFVNGFESKPNL